MTNRQKLLFIPLLFSTISLAETWSPWSYNPSFGGPFSGNYTQFQQRQVPTVVPNFARPAMGFYPKTTRSNKARFNRGHNWQNQNFAPIMPYANSPQLFGQQYSTN